MVNGSLNASGDVTVTGGTLGGAGTVGDVTVNAGGALAPGNSVGTLQTGNLTLAGGLSIELGRSAATPVSDAVQVAGGLLNVVLLAPTWMQIVHLLGADLVWMAYVLVGARVVLGRVGHPSLAEQIILFVAVVFGTLNVVGGFVVTDRMLEMFRARRPDGAE